MFMLQVKGNLKMLEKAILPEKHSYPFKIAESNSAPYLAILELIYFKFKIM